MPAEEQTIGRRHLYPLPPACDPRSCRLGLVSAARRSAPPRRGARGTAAKMGGAGPWRAAEFAGGALRRRGRNEHLAVERVVGLAGGMEAEAALALVADHNAGDLVVGSVDGVSFGHGYPAPDFDRRPLADS